jgi:AraC family transcriptional regulator
VRSIRRREMSQDFVDFYSNEPAHGVAINTRINFGTVTFVHGTSCPVEGRYLGVSQVTVAIHDGAPFDLDWCEAESDHVRSSTISHDQVHIGERRVPFWVRYSASPSFFAFAFDEAFVAEIWHKGFEGAGDFAIRPSVGVDDKIIRRLGALGRHELSEGGAGGRLYGEGLAAMLAVHLLREYGFPKRLPIRHKGGLTPLQMRRVIDYIDTHLADELGIVELAAIAGLSPHHFGAAFKASVGTSPHRFVIERRIQHARQLLRDGDRSIAEIACAAGFSSQSHFTTNFHRVTGMTPGQFRRSLR